MNKPVPIESILDDIASDLGYKRKRLPPYLSTRETSTVLYVSQSALANWRKSGKHNLPFQKVGRFIYYRTNSIASFKNAKEVKHETR